MIALWVVLAQASPLQLDFGPDEGVVFDGFTQVSPRVIGDPRLGWRDVPRRVVDLGWPDPLLADGVADGALHLAIAPGRWTIAALIDDVTFSLKPTPGQRTGLVVDGAEILIEEAGRDAAFFASRRHGVNPRPRFGPDLGPWDRQVAPAFRWRVTTIDVGPAGLVVQPLGAPLSALVLSRDGAATVEVEAAVVDARRREWFRVHRPQWPEDDLPFAQRGPLALEPLAPGRRPSGPRPLPAAIPLAPGELHILMVAVHGGDDPADVTFDGAADLDVAIYEADWLDAQEGRFPRPEPLILRPAEGRVLGDQGLAPLLAVRVRVPGSAAPGERALTLTVRRGDEVATLGVPLRVRGLRLEPARAPLGVWADLRATVASIHGPDSDEARAVWGRDVALMRAFEVELLNLRGAFFPGGWPGVGYEPPVDRLRWAFQAWRDAGGGEAVWVDPSFYFGRAIPRDPWTPAMDAPARETAARMVAAARDVGVGAYVFDEVAALRGASVLDPYRRFLDALNDATAAAPAPLAVADPHAGIWPILADRVDIVYQQHAPHLDPAAGRAFDGRRARAVTYTALYRREATGRIAWFLDTDAVTVWHWGEPTDDPYNDLRPAPQWQLAVLAPDGATPLPTTRLAALAMGVQDQRHLTTTSALVRELAGDRRPAVRAAVAAACEVLDVAASGLIGRLPNDHPRRGLTDDLALEDLRVALGDAAEALARWSKRQRAVRRGQAVAPVPGSWPDACGAPPTLPDAWRYGDRERELTAPRAAPP